MLCSHSFVVILFLISYLLAFCQPGCLGLARQLAGLASKNKENIWKPKRIDEHRSTSMTSCYFCIYVIFMLYLLVFCQPGCLGLARQLAGMASKNIYKYSYIIERAAPMPPTPGRAGGPGAEFSDFLWNFWFLIILCNNYFSSAFFEDPSCPKCNKQPDATFWKRISPYLLYGISFVATLRCFGTPNGSRAA